MSVERLELGRFVVPLIFAVSAAPVFVIAGMVARGHLHLVNGLDARRLRDPAATARTLSRLLAALGFAMLAGGAAMLWADGDRDRITAVALALVVAVNALAVAMVVVVVRARRRPDDGRGPRR